MLSYEPLWKTLIDKHMKKSELVSNKIISTATLAKLGKNQPVNSSIYERICKFLDCDIKDIVQYTK